MQIMRVEYNPQQILHASRWNKFKETGMRLENLEGSASSCVMTVGSDAVQILSVCIAASKQEPPVLLLLLQPKQQRKEVGGDGGQNHRGCMVDRLGAGIWDKAWRQRKLENSPGWNKGFAPCLPQTNPPPPFPPAALLTDGSKGGWVDGLEGLKTLQPHFGAWGECHSCKGGVPRGTCGESHEACEVGACGLMSKEARMPPPPTPGPLLFYPPLSTEEHQGCCRDWGCGAHHTTLNRAPFN